ncbi:KedN5 family methylcobalamin-dependent radical SAM C-methyltransferase [Streptomyces sp. NPDC002537]
MMRICLVQQGAWDMPFESMPLAAGYLKATLTDDPVLAAEVEVDICNFRGGCALPEMACQLFLNRSWDMLAFSVLGWNYHSFGALAEMFKQINPRGIVVFGGNHVAHQSERVFRNFPWVDVVVNGEGENTFRDLVARFLEFPDQFAPDTVAGISFRRTDVGCVTTADRDRINDLDTIPSPFLTGAIPLTDAAGNFRYDAALMETNRGCPYKCAFCYWGGAVGQRMRSFSADRLAAELDMLAFHQAPTIALCDSNFGLLESDEEFVELLIRTREKYGFPQALETSWAKNKSQRFRSIVRQLKRHGFQSSFTLSLQTLNDEALLSMERRNMKVNQWEELVDWLTEEGLDCYGELIWGAPGETPETFLAGYDRLAERVPRTAVYPMLLLPNTSYAENRELHGFVSIRGADDDFEYVLANRSSTLGENLKMQQFIYWARILGEHQYLRHVWRPTRDLASMSQSRLVESLQQFFETSPTPAARAFLDRIPVLAEASAIVAGLRVLYRSPVLHALVEQWWHEVSVPEFPPQWQEFAKELYLYEAWSRPVYVEPGQGLPPGWHLNDSEPHEYVTDPVRFAFDMPEALADWPTALASGPVPKTSTLVFRAPGGFHDHLDIAEMAAHYMTRTEYVRDGRR